MSDLDLTIELLKREIAALRSVLSEFDEDLNCYSQWQKAACLAELRNHLVETK